MLLTNYVFEEDSFRTARKESEFYRAIERSTDIDIGWFFIREIMKNYMRGGQFFFL